MGFQKGHPRFGGRKKGYVTQPVLTIKTAAQKHGVEIIDELWRIASARSKKRGGRYLYDTETRLKAMHMLLDRGYGRPPIDVSMNAKKHIDDFTDAELAIIAGVSLEEITANTTVTEPTGDTPDVPSVDPQRLH